MNSIKILGMAFGSAVLTYIITLVFVGLTDKAYMLPFGLDLLAYIAPITLGPLIGIGGPFILIRKKVGKDVGNQFLFRAIIILVIFCFIATILYYRPAPPI